MKIVLLSEKQWMVEDFSKKKKNIAAELLTVNLFPVQGERLSTAICNETTTSELRTLKAEELKKNAMKV